MSILTKCTSATGMICFVAVLGTSTAAQTITGCAKDEALIVADAMKNAKQITLKAAARVGDTPEYERWFGRYSQRNAEDVRANLKSIVGTIRSGAVTSQCEPAGSDGCEGGTFAWVYPDQHYILHLCPSFFNLPPLTSLRPGQRGSDNGTREGTIVHELSHFLRVARTDDHCYSRRECSDMARSDPGRAVDNADSYQYFTEDVTYFARLPIAGKPKPVERDN